MGVAFCGTFKPPAVSGGVPDGGAACSSCSSLIASAAISPKSADDFRRLTEWTLSPLMALTAMTPARNRRRALYFFNSALK